MKTVLNSVWNKSMLRISGAALSIVLALSMLVAAVPQPALAAGTSTVPCAEHYKVKDTDTKSSIADSFGMKWLPIAVANQLTPNAKLVVGSTLCIPTKQWAASYGRGTMSASAAGKKLSVKMEGFSMGGIWNVRVKDASNSVQGYFKVGRIAVPAKASVTAIYPLPQALLTTPRLKVCVTNSATSVTICQTIKHAM